MSEETARLEETEILDPVLEKVHVGLVPEIGSIGRISDLQSRIARMLPPDSAPHVAWVPPDRYEITLAYMGTMRQPLIAAVQDVCSRVFLKAVPLALQADRLQTSHDARGIPRVLGLGFSPEGHELEPLQRELAAALQELGLEVSPKEFLPRVVLARLSEEAGPVMSVLESFASGFPVTLYFPEVDVMGRFPEGSFARQARILLGRPRQPSLFARSHGCCKSQAGRFSYTLMMECPMQGARASELSCFETGEGPRHPVEESGDVAPVEAGMIHDTTLDLPRIGRRRPLNDSGSSFGDSAKSDWKDSGEMDEDAPLRERPDRGARPPRQDRGPRPPRQDRGPRQERQDRGPRPPRTDRPEPEKPRPQQGAGVNHRDPRKPVAGEESGAKQPGDGNRRRRPGRNRPRGKPEQSNNQGEK